MFKIGLTGGIASGKSTVAGFLRKLGADVLDADVVAHELAEPEMPIWREYVLRYGRERALMVDGRLDRAAIAEIVFSSPDEKKWMDGMSHPIIRSTLERQLDALLESGRVIAVLDIPLLYESGWEKSVDEVWVAFVDESVQLTRLMRRNGLNEDSARARIASQMPIAEKAARADFVIDNSGPKKKTLSQVRLRWELVNERLKATRSI